MVEMKEVTELRARASRAEEILVRAHERGFGEQLATELLADLNQAIDIIERLQQVKIPPLLFGEQLLATAFSLRDSLKDVDENVVEDSPKMWTRVTDALEGSEWLEEYRR